MSGPKLLDPLESGSGHTYSREAGLRVAPLLAMGQVLRVVPVLRMGRLWLRDLALGGWFVRLFGAEFFKFGLGRKVLREVFLIFRKTRANQALVGERKTVLRHLVQGLLGSPALFGHAIGGDHHSGAVITYTAVNKDFLAWVFSDQGEKVRKNSVLRE